MASELTPEEALVVLNKLREKQREHNKNYKRTEKGKESNRKTALSYYHAHREEILEKNRQKRAEARVAREAEKKAIVQNQTIINT